MCDATQALGKASLAAAAGDVRVRPGGAPRRSGAPHEAAEPGLDLPLAPSTTTVPRINTTSGTPVTSTPSKSA